MTLAKGSLRNTEMLPNYTAGPRKPGSLVTLVKESAAGQGSHSGRQVKNGAPWMRGRPGERGCSNSMGFGFQGSKDCYALACSLTYHTLFQVPTLGLPILIPNYKDTQRKGCGLRLEVGEQLKDSGVLGLG